MTIDKLKVIWFSHELHSYLLDCAVDNFENDEEEERQEDANDWESTLVIGRVICRWKRKE